jgi:hypothetical protein
MTGVIVIMAVALFLVGVAIGVLAAVAVAVRREDRRYPLTGEAPGQLTKYARYLNGLVRPDLDGELFPRHGDLRRY